MGLRPAHVLVGIVAGGAGAVLALLGGFGAATAAGNAILGLTLAIARTHTRLAWVIGAVALFAIAPLGDPGPGTLTATALAFCAARWESRWGGVAAFVALAGALQLAAAVDHESFVPYLLVPGACWGAGRALRERELVAGQLAERARELEDEREAHAALSVRYERARIASELHDIVAHAISVMVVQASAGQRLADDPEATAQTFEAIAGAARQAEEDMGRLVALLGDEDAIGPAPDLALAEELVARASGSGLDVTLRLEGEREGLPAAVAEAAYHVVQEGLTNVLRYAAGAAATVVVRGDRRALTVEVVNGPADRETALAGAGTGTGLQGLRERVTALGGTLEAGPTADGGWRVAVRLIRAGDGASHVHPHG